jgi:hypothetical protein
VLSRAVGFGATAPCHSALGFGQLSVGNGDDKVRDQFRSPARYESRAISLDRVRKEEKHILVKMDNPRYK